MRIMFKLQVICEKDALGENEHVTCDVSRIVDEVAATVRHGVKGEGTGEGDFVELPLYRTWIVNCQTMTPDSMILHDANGNRIGTCWIG